MPRPTKLTDDVQFRIVAALRAGNYADAAASSGGIAKATYYDWLTRGRAELEHREEGGRPRAREQPYVEFLGPSDGLAPTLRSMPSRLFARRCPTTGAPPHGTWSAATDRWRRRETHELEHQGSDTQPAVQTVAGVGDPWQTKVAHDYIRALRDGPPAGTEERADG